MIKTKEDLIGKYIIYPSNLSEKKLNRIKKKIEMLGDTSCCIKRGSISKFDKEGNICTFINYSKGIFGDLQEISIKEFLREEEEVVYEGYNCIPNKYMVFYGTDLNDIKEDVERSIQGFNYGKPKKFEDAFEAMHWCIENPMKFISFMIFNSENKINENRILRYNDKISCFQGYPIDYLVNLRDNLKYSNYNLRYILKWKNIVEYRIEELKLIAGERIEKYSPVYIDNNKIFNCKRTMAIGEAYDKGLTYKYKDGIYKNINGSIKRLDKKNTGYYRITDPTIEVEIIESEQ